jgi:hypothetical protein
VVAITLTFLSTFAVPTVLHADGVGGGCQAGCKP